ncbi:MAG: EpsG family protein [Roseburia sp.]|nr:EpsG family protein [Anaeroplasma bactoclasticum]MCM1196717.1 EpsG family protein [Roseburia sp.]MCM1557677.1 EpsG family protein [Anaeroplasma bactoclasticum]
MWKTYLIYGIGTILTILFLGFAEWFKKKEEKYKKWYIIFLILSILPLSLISGLRWGVGTDYFYTYYPSFFRIVAGESPYTELPFVWLNKFISFFWMSPEPIFIITSFVFMTFMILAIDKMSKCIPLSGALIVLGNFWFISMNNVRQCCALAIMIYAFSFFCDHKFGKALILSILASCFHLTSIILAPIFLILSIRKLKKYNLEITMGLFVFTFFALDLAKWLMGLLGYGDFFGFEGLQLPLYTQIALFGYLFLVLLFGRNKMINQDNYAFPLMILSTLAFLVGLESLRFQTMETMSRAILFFSWSSIFTIPYIFKLTKYRWLNLVLGCLAILLVCGYTYYITIYLGHHEVFPYRSIFNKGF